jgi:DNA-binding transcriptional regulator LsrR (DeoR family)
VTAVRRPRPGRPRPGRLPKDADRGGAGLATQAARLFYDRQLSKVEIAQALGISRFRVARLIDDALNDGLVRIEYRDIPAADRGLADAMERQFSLDLCAVTVAPAEDSTTADSAAGSSTVTAVARLAGSVLDGLIVAGDVIGVAWGSTLAAVIREIPTRSDASVHVVQLAGSSARLDRGRDAGDIARVLADRLGGIHHPIFAPTFIETAALRSALVREPEIADAIARFAVLDLAIVGIGAMPRVDGGVESSLLRSGALDAAEVSRLATLGAVGDLVVHVFDATGRFVAQDLAERAVAISVDELRQVRRVVAVASGTGKAPAIRGALLSGVVRILVTDAATARAVLAGI